MVRPTGRERIITVKPSNADELIDMVRSVLADTGERRFVMDKVEPDDPAVIITLDGFYHYSLAWRLLADGGRRAVESAVHYTIAKRDAARAEIARP